jgi:uncharacterized protein YkwD
MLLRARKRHVAARASTCLLVGLSLIVPAPAAAQIAPPVALPGVPVATPALPSPQALAASIRCRHTGARRASAAVLRSAMLCLVNRTRIAAGLRPFGGERHLARAASRHAADMGRRHYFAHVSPAGKSPLSRARSAGWRGDVGEVIAWGCSSLSSPRATLRAWLASPPHRTIILGNAHRAGVGVKRLAGCGGRAYWVIDVG